jgi:hypothetical protein
MDDKKQRGRPKKTDNDTIGLNKKQSQDIPSNYDIPDTDIPDTDIPNTESNDDLKGFNKNTNEITKSIIISEYEIVSIDN